MHDLQLVALYMSIGGKALGPVKSELESSQDV